MGAIEDHGGWKTVLSTLAAGDDLEPAVARAGIATILAGEATPAQTAAFIVALRMKGESVEEISAMVDAMLDAASPLTLPPETIDIVGTGGSAFRRAHALNVSTMAAFVAAAAGAVVCKHGNLRASSTSGSFDLLGTLGVSYEMDGATLAECVRRTGLGFCFARAFHPAMRHAGPVRAEIGIPTVFNLLGPLSHPGRVRRMVMGVGDGDVAPKLAAVLAARGIEKALVVHGADNMDELSTTGVNRVWNVVGDDVTETLVDPGELGIEPATQDALAGGTPADNARICHEVFQGIASPQADIVVLNAGAALMVAGVVDDIAGGISAARDAIDDGRAAAQLDRVVKVSGQLAGH